MPKKVLEIKGDFKPAQDTPKRAGHWTGYLRGKPRVSGEMNATEKAYAEYLEGLRVLGQVQWFIFEAVSFKIGNEARYKPDFLVMTADQTLECHECKGFWAEAAKVRIKVAAYLYPFRFVAVKKLPKKSGGGWETQEF